MVAVAAVGAVVVCLTGAADFLAGLLVAFVVGAAVVEVVVPIAGAYGTAVVESTAVAGFVDAVDAGAFVTVIAVTGAVVTVDFVGG